MQLDAVRGLKANLQESVLAQLNEPPRLRSFGVAAGPMAAAVAGPAAMALGIAPQDGGGYRLAVRLQRRSLAGSPAVEAISRRARGEVDVRYVGRAVKRAPWHQRSARPLRIGCSIGHYEVTAGTLGAFVRSRVDGTLAVLSNNHVLANENRGKKGDTVLQPGKLDGGIDPRDLAGTLATFVRLKRTGPNLIDAALASVGDGIDLAAARLDRNRRLRGLGGELVAEGTEVFKLGRTTGFTRGRVTAFELDNLQVGFDIGTLRFDSQIEIEGTGDGPFSAGGDSGSLIVDGAGRAVALLFAGTDTGGSNGQGLTYATPLRSVLDALRVDLVV